MNNASIARALHRAADVLGLAGADPFRVRAYRDAARAVASEPRPLAERLGGGEARAGGDLTRIPGIGREMAGHIRELVEDGALGFVEKLAAELPPSLLEVATLPGVGPARAWQLRRELGVETVEALETAARTGKVRRLAGFGVASQARILAAIEQRRAEAGERREEEHDRELGAPLEPGLVESADVRGDLQMHSTWSDGRDGIEAMVVACAARGYQYMALTDHSRSLRVAGGLDAADLRRQRVEVEGVRRAHPEIRVLHGVEVEILADGSLDFDDEVLGDLDLVVGAVHSRFDLPADEQTARIRRAVEHPLVDLLAHPTGRKIGRRPPMRFDLDAILRCAAERDVAVELNALPGRMDLTVAHLRRARELGVKVAIDTDAHRVGDLDRMGAGVAQAQRAGLRKEEVLNTMACEPLLRLLGRRCGRDPR